MGIERQSSHYPRWSGNPPATPGNRRSRLLLLSISARGPHLLTSFQVVHFSWPAAWRLLLEPNPSRPLVSWHLTTATGLFLIDLLWIDLRPLTLSGTRRSLKVPRLPPSALLALVPRTPPPLAAPSFPRG